MGRSKGEDHPSPRSLTDALLFTTLCIVGLPVEVQVKDGSLYSGVFHTACVDKGYGIVLKKARKIGRGKCDMDLPVGVFMDTLVVDSGDLVQVVVKDFLLPVEGFAGKVVGVEAASGGMEAGASNGDSKREWQSPVSANGGGVRNSDNNEGKIPPPILSRNGNSEIRGELNEINIHVISLENVQEVQEGCKNSQPEIEEPSNVPGFSVQERQAGKDKHWEQDSFSHRDKLSISNAAVHKVDCTIPSSGTSLPKMEYVDESNIDISSKKNSYGVRCVSPATLPAGLGARDTEFSTSRNLASSNSHTSTVSTSATSSFIVSDSKSSPLSVQLTSTGLSGPSDNLICKKSAKEFKLNPGAKVFLPSFANSRQQFALPSTIESVDYTSNIPPAMPIAGAQSSLEISSFASHSSLPSKLFQYNNLVAERGVVSAHYSRPIPGQAITARQPPVRYSTGQYHPVQVAPTYVYPNSQAVMVGRFGQLMYVHPVPQDAIHGATILSQGSPHPLLVPYHESVTKLQGIAPQPLQVCVPTPLVASEAQHFGVPSYSFPQPFPTVRPVPVPVPGASVLF